MKNAIILTPMARGQLKQLKKHTPYSLSQMAEIAIDYYFDECMGSDDAIDDYLKRGKN